MKDRGQSQSYVQTYLCVRARIMISCCRCLDVRNASISVSLYANIDLFLSPNKIKKLSPVVRTIRLPHTLCQWLPSLQKPSPSLRHLSCSVVWGRTISMDLQEGQIPREQGRVIKFPYLNKQIDKNVNIYWNKQEIKKLKNKYIKK